MRVQNGRSLIVDVQSMSLSQICGSEGVGQEFGNQETIHYRKCRVRAVDDNIMFAELRALQNQLPAPPTGGHDLSRRRLPNGPANDRDLRHQSERTRSGCGVQCANLRAN
jgi:hypothetical protein